MADGKQQAAAAAGGGSAQADAVAKAAAEFAAMNAGSLDKPILRPAFSGGTFAHQEELPSLPVPDLESTMEKLLESAKPLLTDEEMTHSRALVAEFLAGPGPSLQEQLEERAGEEKNWLEDWWENFIYLRGRYPIFVNISWFGCMPNAWGTWKPSQCEAAAMTLRHVLLYRRDLLCGTAEVEKMAGRKLCMNQFARVFNSTRVPQEQMDELRVFDPLQTKHICVLAENRIFKVDVVDDEHRPLPLADLVQQLERCLREARTPFGRGQPEPISVLTTENRDRWAQARERLQGTSTRNKDNLELVETCMFCLRLASCEAGDYRDRAFKALAGDARDIWYDKSFTVIIYEDGVGALNGEHTFADAMVIVSLFDHVANTMGAELRSFADGVPTLGRPDAALPPPAKLDFDLDAPLLQAIELASSNAALLTRTVDLEVLLFKHFGKELMKRYRLVPDFFVQMAIQLAYFRRHGKFVAVYESAHTRLFHHGRTETIRSCSSASRRFCELMCSATGSDGERFEALKAAIDGHLAFAKDCVMGMGIDRHLLGLQVISELSGADPKPSLFTSKLVTETRNFVLSTSNISMRNSIQHGGFMPITTDGVGVAYALQPHMLKFSITTNNDCPSTSASAFKLALETALIDMQKLCLTREVMYVGSAKL